MTRRLSLVLIFLLLISLSTSVTSAQDDGVTLRVGTTYMIDTLNPTNGFYGYTARLLWYDTLVNWSGGDLFQPGLAEAWSVSDDGLTWTFEIREGVTFHDGAPLTAEEAAWNINWILENEIPTMISYMSDVEGAEATDATTLVIHVSQPVPNMITGKLPFVMMLPPSVWQGMTVDEIDSLDGLETTMGSGPYRLVEYQTGEYMVMEANPDYWRGAPLADRLIYQEYATEDAMVQALIAGDIDLIMIVPGSGAAALRRQENVTVEFSFDVRLEELIVNSSPEGTQPASLNDPVVRRAIAHAIDRESIINVGYLGYAEYATTVIPTAMGAFHHAGIPEVPYNLEEANRLLDEAGFVDSNNDGVREFSDGAPLEYRLYAPDSDAYYARIIELISADLASIGIAAPPQVLSDETLIDLQIDYDNDLIYWGWNLDPDPGFLLSIFTCAETVDGGWSDSGYCDEEYDALYAAQATALTQEERIDIIHRMQEKLAEDLPYVPVVYPQTIAAYRNDRFVFSNRLASQPLFWALYDGFAPVG
ncbi:MAG: ABC transporter substrate-binding protein [Chloroflexi bacterium]|nr:ABC transporter substrate-binding protein [Chloroflexota bacterium]